MLATLSDPARTARRLEASAPLAVEADHDLAVLDEHGHGPLQREAQDRLLVLGVPIHQSLLVGSALLAQLYARALAGRAIRHRVHDEGGHGQAGPRRDTSMS